MQKCAHLVDLEHAVKRMFACKISFRYNRERACQRFETILQKIANFAKKTLGSWPWAVVTKSCGRSPAVISTSRPFSLILWQDLMFLKIVLKHFGM